MAEDAGAIVAFVAVFARVPFEELDDPPGHFALVSDSIVRSGGRRRGIGRALLLKAANYARMAGATELRVSVLDGNSEARKLCRSAGFEPYLETLSMRLDSPVTPG